MQRELPQRIAEWMKRLQGEGVRGADLVFACIGPALEVYSRFPRVLDANDNPIPLGGDPEAKEPHKRGFLAYVWEQVGKAALQEVLKRGADTGLEQDARLTALFLWTLQATATKVDTTADEEAEDAEESADDEGEDEEEGEGKGKKAKGFALPFDVVRRFAQPLGIHLDEWERWTISTTKGVVRLIPVIERAPQLLGKNAPAASAAPAKARKKDDTPSLFDNSPDPVEVPAKGRKGKKKADAEAKAAPARELTTLDRIHKAMLLQNSGQTAALRELLADEKARGPEFLRLANALSPLYPAGSWEKQKLDALLQAMPK